MSRDAGPAQLALLTAGDDPAILYRVVKQLMTELDALYAALADPTRREMIARLRNGPLSISDLGAPFGMTLAGVGKHVAALESAGIVRTHKSGRVRSCALVPRG